jgi:GT2 family glycosyltransferase
MSLKDSKKVRLRIAVLVLNWNGVEDTKQCLEKMLEQAKDRIAIFVLDNGSKNNEARTIARYFQNKIKIFRSETNLGFTGGCNFLVKKAASYVPDYYLLINNDAEIGEKFFTNLLNIMDGNNKIGLLNPMIYSKEHPNIIEGSGGYFNWIRAKIVVTKDKPKRIRKTSFASGCALIVRPELLEHEELFDNRFFAYFEDAALSVCSFRKGYEAAVTPNASIYHEGAASTGNESPFKTYLMSRNRILFVKYYMPKIYIAYFAIISTIKLLISLIYFPLHKESKRAIAFSKGYIDGWRSKTGAPSL